MGLSTSQPRSRDLKEATTKLHTHPHAATATGGRYGTIGPPTDSVLQLPCLRAAAGASRTHEGVGWGMETKVPIWSLMPAAPSVLPRIFLRKCSGITFWFSDGSPF